MPIDQTHSVLKQIQGGAVHTQLKLNGETSNKSHEKSRQCRKINIRRLSCLTFISLIYQLQN